MAEGGSLMKTINAKWTAWNDVCVWGSKWASERTMTKCTSGEKMNCTKIAKKEKKGEKADCIMKSWRAEGIKGAKRRKGKKERKDLSSHLTPAKSSTSFATKLKCTHCAIQLPNTHSCVLYTAAISIHHHHQKAHQKAQHRCWCLRLPTIKHNNKPVIVCCQQQQQ